MKNFRSLQTPITLFALTLALALLLFGLASRKAQADFVKGDNPGVVNFYIGAQAQNVSTFTGSAEGYTITASTPSGVTVDVASGVAAIKPNTGVFNDIVFTVPSGKFDDFYTRGQVYDAGSTVEIIVNGAQTFSYTITKANQDFSSIGVVAASGSGETINTIELKDLGSGGFKELKQMEFSLAPGVEPVPESSTLLLVGAGLIALAGWRKRSGKELIEPIPTP